MKKIDTNQSGTYQFGTAIEVKKRLRELVLYVGKRCENETHYGIVKLNKTILFADLQSYLLHGKPITGTAYIKKDRGPVPKLMDEVLGELIESKDIVLVKRDFYEQVQKRYIPLRAADLNVFSGTDISIVDSVIENFKHHSATEVSAISHNKAWAIAEKNGSIPYEAAFISDDKLTKYEIARAKELATNHGW